MQLHGNRSLTSVLRRRHTGATLEEVEMEDFAEDTAPPLHASNLLAVEEEEEVADSAPPGEGLEDNLEVVVGDEQTQL